MTWISFALECYKFHKKGDQHDLRKCTLCIPRIHLIHPFSLLLMMFWWIFSYFGQSHLHLVYHSLLRRIIFCFNFRFTCLLHKIHHWIGRFPFFLCREWIISSFADRSLLFITINDFYNIFIVLWAVEMFLSFLHWTVVLPFPFLSTIYKIQNWWLILWLKLEWKTQYSLIERKKCH